MMRHLKYYCCCIRTCRQLSFTKHLLLATSIQPYKLLMSSSNTSFPQTHKLLINHDLMIMWYIFLSSSCNHLQRIIYIETQILDSRSRTYNISWQLECTAATTLQAQLHELRQNMLADIYCMIQQATFMKLSCCTVSIRWRIYDYRCGGRSGKWHLIQVQIL